MVDPDSMKSTSVSSLYSSYDSYEFQTTWKACVRTNAKNRLGGYIGLTDYEVKFYPNGTLTLSHPAGGISAPAPNCQAHF